MPHDASQKLLVDLTRGVCGGCLFASPLLFTMEMWELGYDTPTAHTLLYLAVAYVFLFGLNALSGFREAEGFFLDLGDAMVSLAIGMLAAAVFLCALGEISTESSALVTLRQVILLALPVSLGVALARFQLKPPEDKQQEGTPHALVHRLGVTIAGALLLGMSAAPTEEIRLIATRVSGAHLLAMTFLAIALAWATLFVAAFPGQGARRRHENHLGEAILAHATSLLVAALLLAAFGFYAGDTSSREMFASVVTLALPATIGAAAGRLIL